MANPVHAFTVLLDWNSEDTQLARSQRIRCGMPVVRSGPGLHYLLPGATRFDTISAIAHESREKYGFTVDFGYEKDGWDGEADRIAHLLLNAVNRAGSSGVDAHQLLRFDTQVLGGNVAVEAAVG